MDRIKFITQVIRLLLSMIPFQRPQGLRDESQEYILELSDEETDN
jgi:hypothetical protein